MFETCRHDDGVIVKFHREEILKREEGLKRTIQKKRTTYRVTDRKRYRSLSGTERSIWRHKTKRIEKNNTGKLTQNKWTKRLPNELILCQFQYSFMLTFIPFSLYSTIYAEIIRYNHYGRTLLLLLLLLFFYTHFSFMFNWFLVCLVKLFWLASFIVFKCFSRSFLLDDLCLSPFVYVCVNVCLFFSVCVKYMYTVHTYIFFLFVFFSLVFASHWLRIHTFIHHSEQKAHLKFE